MRHIIIVARIRWLAEAFDLAGGSATVVPIAVRRRCVLRVLPIMSAARGNSNAAPLDCRILVVGLHGSKAQSGGERLTRLTRRYDADIAVNTTVPTANNTAAAATIAAAMTSVAVWSCRGESGCWTRIRRMRMER